MKITKEILECKLEEILKANAPVRSGYGPVGKKGTNMYSEYPGNLKNNGIIKKSKRGTGCGVILDYTHVGYIGYANRFSRKPQFIEKSIDQFVSWCISLGGKRV